MNRAMKLLTCALVFCAALHAQTTPKSADRWESLRFLTGDWVAKGNGTPGSAVGEYSFREELSGHILVRHSFADYTAQGGGRHEDLLIVYAPTPTEPLHAMYFDSEGHVIRYNVLTKPDTVVFESDSTLSGPRYRLSYRHAGDTLNGEFEVAPPGGTFKTYLSWSSVRK
jgi:hypothetical protein